MQAQIIDQRLRQAYCVIASAQIDTIYRVVVISIREKLGKVVSVKEGAVGRCICRAQGLREAPDWHVSL